MFQRLSNSWELVKASARVLAQDKELLLFPVMSGISLILVSATFVVPGFLFGASISALAEGTLNILGVVVLFLFYFCQYFVIIFFNSALVGATMIRLDGGDPTLGDGLRIAWSRIGAILGYTAIAATVGIILKALRERAGFIGRMVISMVGLAWNLATYLVVPVLVTRGLGPIDAVKESAATFKKTWGEQVAGNVGIGFVFGAMVFGLFALAVPLIGLAIASEQVALIVTAVVLVVVAFLLLMVINSALSGIYQAALYRFATTGQVGAGFDQSTMQTAFTQR